MTFLACLLPSLNACCLPACLLPSLILMIYETAIGEIYATFGTYMAYLSRLIQLVPPVGLGNSLYLGSTACTPHYS